VVRTVVLGSVQTAPEVLERLDRLASAEWVTAIGTLVVAALFVGVAVAALFVLRSLNQSLTRLMQGVERTIARLEPRVEPLLDRAGKIADDASHVSQSLREEVARVQEMLADVNERLYEGLDEAEARLRRFGAVLRVVQREAEDLLLDAAATARGVHVAMDRLRGGPGAGRRRIARADEFDLEEDELEPPEPRRRTAAPGED